MAKIRMFFLGRVQRRDKVQESFQKLEAVHGLFSMHATQLHQAPLHRGLLRFPRHSNLMKSLSN
jgi:hypothetical protein